MIDSWHDKRPVKTICYVRSNLNWFKQNYALFRFRSKCSIVPSKFNSAFTKETRVASCTCRIITNKYIGVLLCVCQYKSTVNISLEAAVINFLIFLRLNKLQQETIYRVSSFKVVFFYCVQVSCDRFFFVLYFVVREDNLV